ncbi:Ig-like domain-containing protein, partial [Bifidobacterium angulatum]|uniref:Ig-like domain-containing protein n=1 Tax=Bifidobacterium angulatum TaxID=1683 RepID=UPI00406CEA87
ACSAEENPDVPVTTVAISGTGVSAGKLSMRKGATAQLTATVNPSNATDRTVSWKSSDTTVVSVDKAGRVSGVKAGTKTDTVTVTVTETSSSPTIVGHTHSVAPETM